MGDPNTDYINEIQQKRPCICSDWKLFGPPKCHTLCYRVKIIVSCICCRNHRTTCSSQHGRYRNGGETSSQIWSGPEQDFISQRFPCIRSDRKLFVHPGSHLIHDVIESNKLYRVYTLAPTALHAAASMGDTEVVARLLQDPRVEPNKISSSRDAHAYAVIGNYLASLNVNVMLSNQKYCILCML